jgi:hypothetical protein
VFCQLFISRVWFGELLCKALPRLASFSKMVIAVSVAVTAAAIPLSVSALLGGLGGPWAGAAAAGLLPIRGSITYRAYIHICYRTIHNTIWNI